ncbi:MAG TPA: hypothetical protein VNS10_10095 [Gemmatimonadaceae bacterium]|jgi:hypothetical protein|nr:hypothetical protein [Gemmatimonadaceae bacterium]
MTDGSRQSVPVRATRIGGAELRGGTIVLEEDALIIVLPVNSEERPVRVPFATIDKIGVEAEDVVVALLDGTRIEVLAESAPDELCDHLLARCCALPEVTRALRAFGSRRRQRDRRGGGAVEQQRFFAPLVDARRIAAKATVPHDVVAAFDPAAIAKAFDDTLTGFATTRFGDYAPARRALEAELVDLAEPLHDALRLLEDAGVAARGAPRDLHAYRQWYARLRDTFEAADRAWLALDAALDSATRS